MPRRRFPAPCPGAEQRVNVRRREFLRFAAAGLVEVGASADWVCRADPRAPFNVRAFGAVADGKALDTSAVNRTIAAAAAAGGGTVRFPAGANACHSIRLKSFVTLHLEAGATILAASAGGYDAAEPNEPFERYQDFGHNHWHNSLIWGEDLRDVDLFLLRQTDWCLRGVNQRQHRLSWILWNRQARRP
jgi:hypothetical protein